MTDGLVEGEQIVLEPGRIDPADLPVVASAETSAPDPTNIQTEPESEADQSQNGL